MSTIASSPASVNAAMLTSRPRPTSSAPVQARGSGAAAVADPARSPVANSVRDWASSASGVAPHRPSVWNRSGAAGREAAASA